MYTLITNERSETLNEQNNFDSYNLDTLFEPSQYDISLSNSYNLDTLFEPENNEIIESINEILNELITNIENESDFFMNPLENQYNNSNQFVDINNLFEENNENEDSDNLEEIELNSNASTHSEISSNDMMLIETDSDDDRYNEDSFFSYSEQIPLFSSQVFNNIIVPYSPLIPYNFNTDEISNLPIIHENDDTGQWLCNKCGLFNDVIEKCCDQEFTWKCNNCETDNGSHLIKCNECNEIRKWTCEICDYSENTIISHTCRQCLTRDDDLIAWTCSECNQDREIKSRFICQHCHEPRECQCGHCITNMLFIPFMLNDLIDENDEIDFTELEDVEINNGLSEDQLNKLDKLEWNNEIKCDMCTVCIDNFKDKDLIYKLPCNHLHCFHVKCLNTWFEKCNTCPICRFKIE